MHLPCIQIISFLAVAASSTSISTPTPAAGSDGPSALTSLPDHLYGKPPNDFDCRSEHNPVVLLHGMVANDQVDLNQLQWDLKDRGYCAFSTKYGSHALVPWIGGLGPMVDSAVEIADFIKEVKIKTNASKVDLVGHSEGGVMTLYVPLTQPGVADMVERTVALGPAVHGARYFGFTDLFYLGGETTRKLAAKALDLVGCQACDDMATGGAVYEAFRAAEDMIVQEGVKASIIMSRSDTLVAPDCSRIDEKGVRNLFVQDHCPDDRVGHAGLAWDGMIWDMIYSELAETYDRNDFTCMQGLGF